MVENISPPVEESPRERNLSQLRSFEKLFDDGYDSDGYLGPFNDAIEAEGIQDFEENFLDSVLHSEEYKAGEAEIMIDEDMLGINVDDAELAVATIVDKNEVEGNVSNFSEVQASVSQPLNLCIHVLWLFLILWKKIITNALWIIFTTWLLSVEQR